MSKSVESTELSPVQTLLCGFGGIVIPRTILAPLDSLKLLNQVYGNKNFPSMFQKRLLTVGVPSLWNGFMCDLIRVPPQAITRYILFDRFKSTIPAPIADNIAAAISASISHPIEVIHTLMCFDPDKYKSIAQTASYVIRKDGFKGLWRGLTPTLVGFIPYRSVQLGAYYLTQRLTIRPTMVNDFLINTSILTVAQAAAYPFDLVRKRLISDETVRGQHMIEVMKRTVEERGIAGLYDGFGFAFLRLLPITWLQQVTTRELRTFISRFNYQMHLHRFG